MFVSYEFVLFLSILLLLYYVLPKKMQWIFLLLASLLFYVSAGIAYPFFLLTTAATVYITGIIIGNYDNQLEEYARTGKNADGIKPSREEKRAYKKKDQQQKTCMDVTVPAVQSWNSCSCKIYQFCD